MKMKTSMLIAVAVATIALGVNGASANEGWDLAHMTDTAPQSQVRSEDRPVASPRPAQVSTASQRFVEGWNFGNG
jgi:hypothetical protein